MKPQRTTQRLKILPLCSVAIVAAIAVVQVRAAQQIRAEAQKVVDVVKAAAVPQEDDKEKTEEEKTEEQKAKERLLEMVEAAAADEIKRVYAATLRAEIAEMSEMFKLKEVDVRKLGVAARGAASKSVEKQRAAVMATVKRMLDRRTGEPNVDLKTIRFNGKPMKVDEPVPGEPLVPKDDEGEDEPKKEQLGITVARRGTYFYFTVRYQRGSSSTSIGPRGTQLRDEEIWKKTTAQVLTDDQVKKYDKHRQAMLKKTIVNMMLAALQFELHLRDSQIEPVREKLEKTIKVTSTQIYIESVVQQYRPQLKSEEFKDILDGPQLDLWESSQAYYRRYLQ